MSESNFKEFLTVLEQLPERVEQVSIGSIFSLSIRKSDGGNKLIVNVPNFGSFKCHREELFALHDRSPEPLLSFTSIPKKFIHPLEFFHCAIATVVDNGYGVVTLEFPESRAFIGKVELSYRRNLKR